ncbi:MAG: L-ribulose-5-phosphate 4-epimerase AraD [Bacilli bacterium]|nr:L-ribulose-5-phosphate 4-epimerase AraD [Bacilli bacterium]
MNKLKKIVYEENLNLVKNDLVILTWGNVSMADRKLGVFVIKPSGVSYEKMKPEDMVVVSLKTGKKVGGKLNPSSDTPTHYELYKKFTKVNGIVHTHSMFATAFAQAGEDIIPLGTTHADTFYQSIPCAKKLSANEIKKDYEANTGKAIIKEFNRRHLDYLATPAVLLESHGPFAWGKDAHEAVKNAITLEAVAKMNFLTYSINPKVKKIDQYLSNKHYERKHGKNAYYGQK